MADYERDDLLEPLTRFSRVELRYICSRLGLSRDFAVDKEALAIAMDLVYEFENRASTEQQGRNHLAAELIKRKILIASDKGLVRSQNYEITVPPTAANEEITKLSAEASVELLRQRVLRGLGPEEVERWCYNMMANEPRLRYDYSGLEANVTNVLYQASLLEKKQWRMLIEQLNKTKPGILKEDELDIWRNWADEQDKDK